MREKALMAVAICMGCLLGTSARGQEHYALLVGGLGGMSEQTHRLRQLLYDAHQALISPLGYDEAHVTVLGETALEGEPMIDGISTAEAIRDWFELIAERVGANDQVMVILFGHGSFDGRASRFNIPRRDLTAEQFANLLNQVPAGRSIFVNTASASAPFIPALSSPGAIVITATRTASQANQTIFPEYFVDALANPAADLDKDGGLSVREAFRFASEHTAAMFEASGHLATEHSLLEDTGDGTGYRARDLDEHGEGKLAAVTYLSRQSATTATTFASPLEADKNRLLRGIAGLIARKSTLTSEQYYTDLEQLFVALARLNDKIDSTSQ